jgi:hypothetical protein
MPLMMLGRQKYTQQKNNLPQQSALEVDLAIEKLKGLKSPGTDQIPAELIKAGGIKIRSKIHKLIVSIWNKEDLPEEWKEPIIVPVYKKGDQKNCGDYKRTSFSQLHIKICTTFCCQS